MVAAPETASPPHSARSTAIIAAQLLLAWGVIAGFRIESTSFRTGLAILFLAYPIQVALPDRGRLPFFGMLSIASIIYVAGWINASWILILGGLLIALCHLPVPFRFRLLLIGLSTLGLAIFRATPPTSLPRPWSELVWPILASMFMFRLMIYLYDLRHRSAPFGFWRAVAYFFMAPNVWFPLFPIVDYQAMNRPVPEAERFRIHQVGVDWIIRGTIQLILYRLVYQHLLVDPAGIDSVGRLAQALVATFLLYLRISGSFHLIVGILRLFNFNLPETHHLYFLASSFSDFWRRINIYWKDFVMKLAFYPVFFRLRRRHPAGAMIGATLIAFFATWCLHSWQWFWMRGTFLVTLNDSLFWIILALLVTVDAVRESAPGRRPPTRGLASDARRAVATVGTFIALTLLWSFWTAGSWYEFAALFAGAGHLRLVDVALVIGILGVIAAWSILDNRSKRLVTGAASGPTFSWRPVLQNAGVALFLVAMATRPIQSRLPAPVGQLFAELENPKLNEQDLELLQRGYYEDLTQVHRFSHDLAIVYGERPPDYFIPWREAMRVETNDYYQEVLKPSAACTYMSVPYTTNRWGMRDRDYSKERVVGTRRIALIGSSYTLGWGVGDDVTFESIAESRLNESGISCEILNFAVHAYDPVRNLLTLEDRVLDFHPDAAILFCNTNERKTLVTNLAHAIEKGIPLPYPFLDSLRVEAEVDRNTERAEMERRLARIADRAIAESFRLFAARCHAEGIVPIWIFMPETIARASELPLPDVDANTAPAAAFRVMARDAGFDRVTDLAPAFVGVNGEELKLFAWDFHPNVRGHQLLAGEFESFLRQYFALAKPE